MKPKYVKQALTDAIQAIADYKWLYSVRPGKDNTRNRKFPFSKMISSILALRGGTLNREIMDFFGFDPGIGTSSAFIQQRAKILPEAFLSLFQHFTSKIDENKLYHGLRLLAVDGSDLQIAANPNDSDSYYPDANGQKAYNLLHLHAKKVEFVFREIFAKLTMYNFCELITQSVVIKQKQKKYVYKVNFSDAVHICFEFFLGNAPPPVVEAMLMKYISPIRPGRKDTRKQTQKPAVSFTYRIA